MVYVLHNYVHRLFILLLCCLLAGEMGKKILISFVSNALKVSILLCKMWKPVNKLGPLTSVAFVSIKKGQTEVGSRKGITEASPTPTIFVERLHFLSNVEQKISKVMFCRANSNNFYHVSSISTALDK